MKLEEYGKKGGRIAVAPLTGAWIEIRMGYFLQLMIASLPSRERGLKLHPVSLLICCLAVAPLAGAWIEITLLQCKILLRIVAPLAGAWIEICYQALVDRIGRVAPLAGAWIEI